MGIKKQSKYFYLLMAVFLICVGVVSYCVYNWIDEQSAKDRTPKEKTMEEIISSLTAPTGAEKTEVPKEVIDSLTAPAGAKGTEVSDEVIKSLTAPK